MPLPMPVEDTPPHLRDYGASLPDIPFESLEASNSQRIEDLKTDFFIVAAVAGVLSLQVLGVLPINP